MKKTIITISVVAVMAVAVACIFCTIKANENPFLNANVEALARAEGGGGIARCYSTITVPGNTLILRCHTCDYVLGTTGAGWGLCW